MRKHVGKAMTAGQFMKMLALCGYPANGKNISGGGIGLKSPGILAQSAAPVSVTGTTAETVLASPRVPAYAIGKIGALRITALWSYSNNSNVKTIRGRFGGEAYFKLLASTQLSLTFVKSIRNRNSYNAQVSESMWSAGLATSTGEICTLSVDTTKDQLLTFTAELANVTDTVTLEGYTVELLNP